MFNSTPPHVKNTTSDKYREYAENTSILNNSLVRITRIG